MAAPCFGVQTIVLDSTSSIVSPPATSVTWSHTTAGVSRFLYVGVGVHGLSTISSATYAGVLLTQISSTAYVGGSVWQFYQVAPTVGTNNIVVNFSGSATAEAGGISLTGVNQITAVEVSTCATGTSTTPSLSITTLTNNAWVLDVVGNSSFLTPLTATGSQTLRFHAQGTTGACAGGTLGPVTPPAATTMSWSQTGSVVWGECAVSAVPGDDPSGGDPTLLLMHGSD